MAKTQIHRRQFEKEIRVGLNPNEREPITAELLFELNEIDKLRVEQAQVAATYRKTINDRTEKCEHLRVTLEQGNPETHLVEEIRNFSKMTVTTKRVDTGAIVELRPMTDEDSQLPISDLPNGTVDGDEDEDTETEKTGKSRKMSIAH